MPKVTSIDKAKIYLNEKLNPSLTQDHPPSITISRMTGAGGTATAIILAEYLQEKDKNPSPPWTVFDKDLIEKVLEDHNLPKKLAKYIPEKKISGIDALMGEIFGIHPPVETLVKQTTETIYKLSQMGHSIIVGRGGNLITSKLKNVCHVRLVASEKQRIERIMKTRGLSRLKAVEFIRETEKSRADYIRQHFSRDINDPTLYHLIINNDRFNDKEVVSLIGDTVLKYFG